MRPDAPAKRIETGRGEEDGQEPKSPAAPLFWCVEVGTGLDLR